MTTLDCRQATHKGHQTYRQQISAILKAHPERSHDYEGLAKEVGCTVLTARRYCEEYNGLRAVRAKIHHGYENPEKQAICSLLLDAVDDWISGRPCGKQCKVKEGHHCAPAAAEFLASELGRTLLDLVGLDSDLILSRLGIGEECDGQKITPVHPSLTTPFWDL